MMQVNWIKCNSSKNWCPFVNVNLDGITTQGVYIIWHSGNPGKIVYIGQGDIAARLKAHRNRTDITKYARSGDLYVTWASVPAAQRDGVERYLANKWNPLIGDAHPDAVPIAVNSPW